MLLKGNHISLRALEPSDIDFLFDLENNTELWEFSNTITPYSKHLLKNYIQNAHQDIYEAKQFRFVIQNEALKPVGFIDLFEFDPKHQRVGVGLILIASEQQKGYAKDALACLCNYCFTHLNVQQVFANITNDNFRSIALFEKLNFVKTGTKKNWIFSNGIFKDEHFYQLLKSDYEE